MTSSSAIFLTAYNRPTLVGDAIQSVLTQDCDRWHLYILDDGSNDETRRAIQAACGNPAWVCEQDVAGGIVAESGQLTWWRGPSRSMEERRATIPYDRTINIGLNHLLRDEQYVCYLVDDDFLYPESVRMRAACLDARPDAHVVYGRTRSIEYDAQGFNQWKSATRPQAGMAFPRPTGKRQSEPGVGGKRCYFAPGDAEQSDPQTGLLYVDEGYWELGWMAYGQPAMCDHNQVMHRTDCLTRCFEWPNKPDGTHEFWGEDLHWGVGDAAFFSQLAKVHPFWGVDAWVCSKRFHSKSWGTPDDEVRE